MLYALNLEKKYVFFKEIVKKKNKRNISPTYINNINYKYRTSQSLLKQYVVHFHLTYWCVHLH